MRNHKAAIQKRRDNQERRMHFEFCHGKEGNPRNHDRLDPADRFDAVCADLPGKNEHHDRDDRLNGQCHAFDNRGLAETLDDAQQDDQCERRRYDGCDKSNQEAGPPACAVADIRGDFRGDRARQCVRKGEHI